MPARTGGEGGRSVVGSSGSALKTLPLFLGPKETSLSLVEKKHLNVKRREDERRRKDSESFSLFFTHRQRQQTRFKRTCSRRDL